MLNILKTDFQGTLKSLIIKAKFPYFYFRSSILNELNNINELLLI